MIKIKIALSKDKVRIYIKRGTTVREADPLTYDLDLQSLAKLGQG